MLTQQFSPLAYRYPVILSIENHCSIKQQQAMAHYLKTLLGDKLYTDNVDTSLNGMPSPEALKGKILVKVRNNLIIPLGS